MTELLKGILIAAIPCGIIIGYLLIKLDQIRWEREFHKEGYEYLQKKYEKLREKYEPEYPCNVCHRGWGYIYLDGTVKQCSDTCQKLKDYVNSQMIIEGEVKHHGR